MLLYVLCIIMPLESGAKIQILFQTKEPVDKNNTNATLFPFCPRTRNSVACQSYNRSSIFVIASLPDGRGAKASTILKSLSMTTKRGM